MWTHSTIILASAHQQAVGRIWSIYFALVYFSSHSSNFSFVAPGFLYATNDSHFSFDPFLIACNRKRSSNSKHQTYQQKLQTQFRTSTLSLYVCWWYATEQQTYNTLISSLSRWHFFSVLNFNQHEHIFCILVLPSAFIFFSKNSILFQLQSYIYHSVSSALHNPIRYYSCSTPHFN